MLRRVLILFRDRSEGAATVEFALLSIPLLLLVTGLLDFGDGYYCKQLVTNAARAGARYGIRFQVDANGNRIPPSASSIQTFVQTNYGADLTVKTAGTGLTSNKSGDPLSVTVTKAKNWIFSTFLSSFVIDLPTQISSTITMTLE